MANTGIIDADTHIIESEAVWEHFDKEMAHRKPVAVPCKDPVSGQVRNRWLIDGTLVPKPDGKGGQALATPPVDSAEAAGHSWRTKALLDIEGRLADADKMGVEMQVVFPTLFIAHLTWDAELDVALARSYNRFLAEAWSNSHDRLRWVAVLPFHDIPRAIEELHWAREHGAVGFLARGLEGDRSLAEPYFFPVYQAASQLDLPMCIHTGPGAPAISSVIDNTISGSFSGVRLLPLIGFQNLVGQRIPERFPDLRIGFIETGASWVPYVLHYVERDWRRKHLLDTPHLGPELFKNYRIYVACESDEDIPYLAGYVGEDNLISGSDYGHHAGQLPTLEANSFTNRLQGGDPSADLALVGELRAREDLSRATTDKILQVNPRRFYGLK
jgi:predicted TIM-barrel fold metal-dependent hydrolase